jgi:hypothetical protein
MLTILVELRPSRHLVGDEKGNMHFIEYPFPDYKHPIEIPPFTRNWRVPIAPPIENKFYSNLDTFETVDVEINSMNEGDMLFGVGFCKENETWYISRCK